MMEITFSQNTIEYLLLILVRVASFVYAAPFFSHRSFPARVKMAFSLWLTVVLFYSMPEANVEYATVIDYAAIIIKESIVGLMIGFSAYIYSTIVAFSGKIMDMEIGLSMAQIFDPSTNTQSGLTGSLYSYLIMLLLVVSNMQIFLLNALVDSYSVIPINGMKINFSMYPTVIGFITDYFLVGFRIALPIFACILMLNCVLGVMAKVAPQMNMFAVGMQMKIMVGFVVLFLTISLLPSVANFIFTEMKKLMVLFIEGMY